MNCEYRRGNDTDAWLHKVKLPNQVLIEIKRATQRCILFKDIATRYTIFCPS